MQEKGAVGSFNSTYFLIWFLRASLNSLNLHLGILILSLKGSTSKLTRAWAETKMLPIEQEITDCKKPLQSRNKSIWENVSVCVEVKKGIIPSFQI